MLLSSIIALAGNPAVALRSKQQAKMLSALNVRDANFCTLTYAADYKLPLALQKGSRGTNELLLFVGTELLDATALAGSHGAGCSAFVCNTPDGDVLFCRNFDYDFNEAPVEMLCKVPRKISGGNASISMVALNFLGYKGGELNDGATDISKLVGAPYAAMDGMNDKGLAICVLQVDSFGAEQHEEGKPNASTSLMIRWILDKAANVDEALKLFESVNFFAHGEKYRSNYHFFLADKSGKSVIVEYVQQTKGAPAKRVSKPYVMHVQSTQWAANNFFYPDWNNPKSDHGRDKILDSTLKATGGVMDLQRAWSLLGRVTQEQTRWSVIYNLSRGTVEYTWESSGRTERIKL